MTARPLHVFVEYDAAARVFTARSYDISGLLSEHEDLHALIAKLRRVVPDLLRANQPAEPVRDIEVRLTGAHVIEIPAVSAGRRRAS